MSTSRCFALWLAGAALLVPSVATAADRFVLLVTQDLPHRDFVQAAAREGAATGDVPEAAIVLQKLTRAYPALLEGPAPRDLASVIEDFRAASEAHYATQLDQAEKHFARGFGLLYQRPDILGTQAEALEAIADAAALRFRNAAASGQEAEGRRELEAFIRRYPDALPPRANHPPAHFELWEVIRRAVMANEGALTVHALPLEWERAGDCSVFVNGAVRGTLPQAGRLRLPAGPHLVQVRCGARVGWLQRVEVGARPVTITVPVRAQLAAQVDPGTGVVTLVRPSEGDAAQLVESISASAGFQGANVVRTAIGRALIGTWTPGADSPSDRRQGELVSQGSDARPSGIVRVTSVMASHDASAPSRTWTWVSGGTGLALVAGGLVTQLYREGTIEDRGGAANLTENDRAVASDLETLSTGLYVGGGLLVGAAIVLYFVEGAQPSPDAATVRGPGQVELTWRF